jgi:hypothetical protein
MNWSSSASSCASATRHVICCPALLDELQLLTRTVPLRFPSPEAFFDALLRPLPLGPHDRDAVRPELERVLASCNNRPPEVEVGARYLIALGRRAP